VLKQIAAFPVEALPFCAKVFGVLELDPWSGQPQHDGNPEGAVRPWRSWPDRHPARAGPGRCADLMILPVRLGDHLIQSAAVGKARELDATDVSPYWGRRSCRVHGSYALGDVVGRSLLSPGAAGLATSPKICGTRHSLRRRRVGVSAGRVVLLVAALAKPVCNDS
jgi:hypothetical protein